MQDRGFPQCRVKVLQGGRPPAQTCRDAVPDELEQVRGEVRWDFTKQRALLMKGQGEKRRNWLQKDRKLTAGQVFAARENGMGNVANIHDACQ